MNTSTLKSVAATPVGASAKRRPLDAIVAGRIKAPWRIVLYGAEKVGKSTFASGAPAPIWLGADAGTEHLDIKRLPAPASWADALDSVADVEARGKALGFATLVIDPVGWLEPLIHVDVTGDPSVPLEKWAGGYGRGIAAAFDRWRALVRHLERVHDAGLNVLLIGHATVRSFNDPEGPGYDRYELDLKVKGASGLLRQWADAILFAKREVYGKQEAGGAKAKAFGSAAHMLHTKFSPAFDAGNRWTLPEVLPLSWAAFSAALEKGETEADELRKRIDAGLAELGDPTAAATVRGWIADKTYDLAEVANAVEAKLAEARAKKEG
jgi:hypothetical protein